MEFLDIPLFDDDFYKMILRFFINLFFLTAIVKYIYHKHNENKDYFFTFYAIGIVVFFLCFTLKKYELDLGMALGLFAIFGILRYRTVPLDVKEMTYLFVIIGISVMNALSNKKMSYIEIVTANSAIVFGLYWLELYWSSNFMLSKKIVYETIENIHPSNHEKLKKDLEERLGIEIYDFEIGDVNFLRDTAQITIRYKP
ncbi:DUF4956 domain-containing protein [Flavobacteriaceae bacterium]|jgi:hypothetical protein|nr:DUF4956 domain-containing protein [Flavobacteriaceae bacterium]MDA9631894.1 DUF4956 domain-containing protein [Bacteroidota bacterium]MDA9284561.1 DUF4956 domain-containing protein [Flavobacteriaceae bacterium]MDB4134622.1 DUF4956 domain-containing protein [Flavobacteriaceae bacterium]MDB4180102.1 DUF4956 domain-containing protein [Flavobacteriaceae bacterium]|tara:strand:+ start:60 stop:656 length:597 start_codon:yes stop_codon:yes gene_type:complete